MKIISSKEQIKYKSLENPKSKNNKKQISAENFQKNENYFQSANIFSSFNKNLLLNHISFKGQTKTFSKEHIIVKSIL